MYKHLFPAAYHERIEAGSLQKIALARFGGDEKVCGGV